MKLPTNLAKLCRAVRLSDRKLLTGTELAIKQCACMRFLGRKMLKAQLNALLINLMQNTDV